MDNLMNRRQAITAMGAAALATVLPTIAPATPTPIIEDLSQIAALDLKPGTLLLIVGMNEGEPEIEHFGMCQEISKSLRCVMPSTTTFFEHARLRDLRMRIARHRLRQEICDWIHADNLRRNPGHNVLDPDLADPENWLYTMGFLHECCDGDEAWLLKDWKRRDPLGVNMLVTPWLKSFQVLAEADITLVARPDGFDVVAHRWNDCATTNKDISKCVRSWQNYLAKHYGKRTYGTPV